MEQTHPIPQSSASQPQGHAQAIRAAAQAIHSLGFNVTAIAGEKRPGHRWRHFQRVRQADANFASLPWHDATGFGVISGVAGIRIFDFDQAPDDAPLRIVRGVLGLPPAYPWCWRSGSGNGFGLAVLCFDDLPQSKDAPLGLLDAPGVGCGHLELRYDRCQTILPPSQHPSGPGYVWLDAAPAGPPALVPVERILAAFRAVTVPAPATPAAPPPPVRANGVRPSRAHYAPPGDERASDERPGDELARNMSWHASDERPGDELAREMSWRASAERPGDELARNMSWRRILEPHGWRAVRTSGPVTLWVRPGKDPRKGHSATTGGGGADVLYVFSTNAPPFQPRQSYTKFCAWTLLNHAGSFTAAARALRARQISAPGPVVLGPGRSRAAGYSSPQTGGSRPRRTDSAVLIDFLGQQGHSFRLNTCDDSVEVNGERITDAVRCEMRVKLRDGGYGGCLGAAEDAWTASARQHPYHPITGYLESLPPWDGRDHIAALTACFDDANGVFPLYLCRWLVGAVARASTGCQNAVLVLEGRQGLGKSRFARWLCPLPAMFVDAPIIPESKDHALLAMRSFIWEISELGSTTRRADVDLLKGFLSRERFTVRAPFARYEITRPGLASFIGTANDTGGIFVDTTGTRRYWATTITRLDWSYAGKIDLHAVWAQAYAAYRRGEPWTLSPAEAARARDINEVYACPDPVEDLLRECFHLDPRDRTHWTSSADILKTLVSEGLAGGSPKANHMQIAATLKRLGLAKMKSREKNGYAGIWPRRQPPTSANLGS